MAMTEPCEGADVEASAPLVPESVETSKPEVAATPALVVSDVVGPRHATVCFRSSTLAAAAEIMLSRQVTALVILDERGIVAGALTENDLLQALCIGVPWNYSLNSWLCSDCARLPHFLVEDRAIPPTMPLLEAAARMAEHAGAGDYACHHLLVHEGPDEPWGILSSLDLAQAVFRSSHLPASRSAKLLRASLVAEVMKPRPALPTCDKESSLNGALYEMMATRQNCALITEEANAKSPVLGVITTRDAVRAFVENNDGKICVAEWLQKFHSRWEPRGIASDKSLFDAAELMAANLHHHLVVVSPATSEVVGVISTLDMARAMTSRGVEEETPMKADFGGDEESATKAEVGGA